MLLTYTAINTCGDEISGEMAINSQDSGFARHGVSTTAIPNSPFRIEKPRDLLNTEEQLSNSKSTLNRKSTPPQNLSWLKQLGEGNVAMGEHEVCLAL